MVEAVKTHHRKRKRQSRRRWVAGLLLVCFALAGVVLVIAIRNAEPILQARIVETLSTRFHITQSLSQWPTDEIEDEKPREEGSSACSFSFGGSPQIIANKLFSLT